MTPAHKCVLISRLRYPPAFLTPHLQCLGDISNLTSSTPNSWLSPSLQKTCASAIISYLDYCNRLPTGLPCLPLPPISYSQHSNQAQRLKRTSDIITQSKIQNSSNCLKTLYDSCFPQPISLWPYLPCPLSIHCYSYCFFQHLIHFCLLYVLSSPNTFTAYPLTSIRSLLKYQFIRNHSWTRHKTVTHPSTQNSLPLRYCFCSIQHHVIYELFAFLF